MDLSMDFQWWEGIVAGAAATMAMTAVMMMGSAMGMSRMNMGLILGSMFARRRSQAETIGWPMHLMMGLGFGLLYALLWWVFDPAEASDAWWYGLTFGAVHGVVAMAAMPMMGAMNPRAEAVPAGSERHPETAEGEEVVLPRFGFGGTGFGSMTPIGIEMGHLVYGVVWGLVFWALI